MFFFKWYESRGACLQFIMCVLFFFFLQTQSSARSLVGSSLEGTVTPPASAWLPHMLPERDRPLTCVVTPRDGWVHFVTTDNCTSEWGRSKTVEHGG